MRSGRDALPVVDLDGGLLGVVSLRAFERDADHLPRQIEKLVEPVPRLVGKQPLAEAVDWLAGGEREGLPVLADDGSGIVGWLDHRDVRPMTRPDEPQLTGVAPGR